MTLNQKITLSFLSLAMTSISLQAGVVRGIVFDTTVVAYTGVHEDDIFLDIPLEPDATTLSEVTVTATARKDTEAAMMEEERQSDVVQSGVSAQHIAKTQDKDASEVIRRVPGISIIDDRFVMVRGLSQRYNNVWLNGSAVPSSEADSRAFSFDIIPSSHIQVLIFLRVHRQMT